MDGSINSYIEESTQHDLNAEIDRIARRQEDILVRGRKALEVAALLAVSFFGIKMPSSLLVLCDGPLRANHRRTDGLMTGDGMWQEIRFDGDTLVRAEQRHVLEESSVRMEVSVQFGERFRKALEARGMLEYANGEIERCLKT